LLDPAERVLFARFAVFSGGFTLEAADAVCNVAGGLPLEILDGVDSLVQKSLLRQESGPGGDHRFVMLETIREFALELMQELLEVDELRQAHADTYLAMAESADWENPAHHQELLDLLDADHANLRQAIGFYEQKGAAGLAKLVRMAHELAYFWWLRGYFDEGRGILERVIATQGDIPTEERAAVFSEAAYLAEAQGDFERAQAYQEEALALHETSGDTDGIATALGGLGEIARQRGDLTRARRRHGEALEAWRRVGDSAGVAGALLDVGLIRQLEGDYAGAEPDLQESLTLFRRVHDKLGEAHALNRLGLLAMSTGDLPKATQRFEQSLQLWGELGNQQMIASDTHNLGEALHHSGALEDAEHLYRNALSLFEDLGDLRGRGFALCHLGLLALDRGNAAEARELLLKALKLRWGARLRASAADALEALAEATWQLGDVKMAAAILQAGHMLRQETGLARQPVYESRYQRVTVAVAAAAPTAEVHDVDAFIAKLLGDQLAVAPIESSTQKRSGVTPRDLPT
jgi:tetratricopeptide (TPR) repeat protein